MSRTWRNIAGMVGVAVALAGVTAAPAAADMHTEQLSDHLCKTTRGGKFVRIPGFPGERIDRRLLPDIRWMKRKFDIWITDGYATSGHAINGEHPIGLALDIVPNRSTGGNWHKLGNLARRFEPHQNQVRLPFRWIGWNGDAGHGRGDHLHLSYAHSPTRPRHPARVVYTRNCPGQRRNHGSGGAAEAEAAEATAQAGSAGERRSSAVALPRTSSPSSLRWSPRARSQAPTDAR